MLTQIRESFSGVLQRIADDALDFQQNSQVVTWTGEEGWDSASGGDYERINFVFNRLLTQSGIRVNGRHAMTISAFWACVKMISEDIAKLPVNMCEMDYLGNQQIRNNHWLYYLISTSPDGQIRAQKFWETMIQWALVWGNGYALLPERNQMNGQLDTLELVHPNRVNIKVRNGIRTYQIYPNEQDKYDDNNGRDFPNYRMFHLDGLGDKWSGFPIATFARECLGISLSLQTLQASLFANGMSLGGVLETEQTLNFETRQGMAEEWQAKYGGASNRGKTAILDNGLSYKPITSKAVDNEVLESRKFQILEVARFFRVPPHKLGITDAATMNNMEQENKSYFNDTLDPWINRIEKEGEFKLLPRRSRFYICFDTKSLTMPDTDSKTKFWSELIKNGAATPNQFAQAFGLPTYEGGDTYYIASNNLTPVATQSQDKQLEASEQMGLNEPGDRDPFEQMESFLTKVVAGSLDRVIEREVKFHERYSDKAKFEEKEQDFYQIQLQYYNDVLSVFYSELNFHPSASYFEQWNKWNGENWKEKKSAKMAEDFVDKFYLKRGSKNG